MRNPQQNNLFTENPALVSLLLGQGLFLGLTVTILFASSVALFLEEHGADRLPYVYILIAIFVSLASMIFFKLEKKWPVPRLLMSTVFFFVPAIFIARAGMALPHSAWISYGLMCLSVSLVQFAMIILGIQVRQFYDVRQIKKYFH